jgi:hypothetical protein
VRLISRGSVRTGVPGVANPYVWGALLVREQLGSDPRSSSISEISRHAGTCRLRGTSGRSRLDMRMGRKSKGERHTFMTRVPELAGTRVRREVVALGCHYTDYLAYVICRHVGVPMEIPTGDVADHAEPPAVADGRVQFIARVPMKAASIVRGEAEDMGVSFSDYIAKAICDFHDVPFEPRVMKKALKAWAKAAEAGERMPMTG